MRDFMHALIHTVAFRGLDTVPVSVQAHLQEAMAYRKIRLVL